MLELFSSKYGYWDICCIIKSNWLKRSTCKGENTGITTRDNTVKKGKTVRNTIIGVTFLIHLLLEHYEYGNCSQTLKNLIHSASRKLELISTHIYMLAYM